MREKGIHKIEAHVGCLCFHKGKLFSMKRSATRSLFPNFWTTGGGQVKGGENFKEAAIRKLKEEAGIIAEPHAVSDVYEILTPDLDQKKIPGMYITCTFTGYINKKEPTLNAEEHTEWKWIPVEEVEDYEFIPDLKKNILSAYKTIAS